jgi:hypothetical protein
VNLTRVNALRARAADSRTAAVAYFSIVLLSLAVGRVWVGATTVALVGVVVYAAPAPFTWPLLDAAFSRYSRAPGVNAAAGRRMPWVWCVLAGIGASIVIGGLG